MKNKTANSDNTKFLEIAQAIAKKMIYANKVLAIEIKEKEKLTKQLIIANKELVFQNGEKEIRKKELSLAYDDLKKSEQDLTRYIEGMKTMMFMTSHRVRQPIAHILGTSALLPNSLNSPEDLKILVGYIRESALALDTFTEELTQFMIHLEKNEKNKIQF